MAARFPVGPPAGGGGGSTRKDRPRDVIPVVDLVGLSQIAERLMVPLRVLQYWERSGRLPAPDYRWSDTYAWVWETIKQWTGARHRRPSETPLWSHLMATVAAARELVADGASTPRLRGLIEEVATEETALLGTSSLFLRELSDAEFLDQFDAIQKPWRARQFLNTSDHLSDHRRSLRCLATQSDLNETPNICCRASVPKQGHNVPLMRGEFAESVEVGSEPP